MFHTLLVFAHLLAVSMALGAIVATDLRLLSKLSQDRLRIAPPNEFVARIVMVALLLLYVTGGGLIWLGSLERSDYLTGNPKLQAKILLVVLLTINAFVLHRFTFPRLARGRRVARWHASDWVLVAVPVAVSNFLWMFVAFLGIARPWNYTMPMRDILEVAAALYIVAQVGVFIVLAAAANTAAPDRSRMSDVLRLSLARLGSLGTTVAADERRSPRRRSSPRPRRDGERDGSIATPASPPLAGDEAPPSPMATSLSGRPALRLVTPEAIAVTPRQRSR